MFRWRRVLVVMLAFALMTAVTASCKKKEAPKQEQPKAVQEQPKKEEPKKEEPKKEEPKVIDKPIVIGAGGEPNALDPQYQEDSNMRLITENIFDPLLRQKRDSFQLEPSLAERYENINPTTWRFWLRKDVKFHNGEPFTAEAVVFSVKRVLDPNFNSGLRSWMEGMVEAKAVESHVVDIITDGPNPILPTRLSLLPIMEPKHVQAVGKDVVDKPVGTGPYKLQEWVRGSHVTLVRNDAYWGPKPPVSKTTFRFMVEDATRLLALRNGEVHVAINMFPEFKDQLPVAKSIPGLEFPAIRLNSRKAVISDQRVRQALNYAIDKEALRDSLYKGFAKVTQCQQGKPEFPGFNKDVKPYPFDPDKAKQLLKDAGYKGEKVEFVGERGRWLKDGELTEAVGAMLQNIGFNVDVKIVEFGKWLDIYLSDEPAPLMFISTSNDLGDQDKILSNNVLSTGRQSDFRSPEIDKIINDNRKEMDAAKRSAVYSDLWAQLCDNPPWIYLLNLENIYGADPNLNWEPRLDVNILVKDMTWKK